MRKLTELMADLIERAANLRYVRQTEALLGVLAWLISFGLVIFGAPKNKAVSVSILLLFFAAYIFFVLCASRSRERIERQTSNDELARDTYTLAKELRGLFEGPLIFGVSKGVQLAQYQATYQYRVKRLLEKFRSTNVPQTNYVFKLAQDGPACDWDVFSIAMGLEVLANELQMHNWVVHN